MRRLKMGFFLAALLGAGILTRGPRHGRASRKLDVGNRL